MTYPFDSAYSVLLFWNTVCLRPLRSFGNGGLGTPLLLDTKDVESFNGMYQSFVIRLFCLVRKAVML